MNFIDQIENFRPQNEQQQKEKKVILSYIQQFAHNILLRDNEFAHMTSSGFIMNKRLDKILMIHHNIYNTWAWTGGHADGDSDFLSIALREAQEETGVKNIYPLFNDIASLDILPVWGHFKGAEYICTHLHLNSSYILIASEDEKLEVNEKETTGVRWISAMEMDQFSNEPKMVVIYQRLIQRALFFTGD
ncbi:MAG: NUDIX hydrolase [Oligoflexia bacterium]|nr:NUDIX hydrolase [Oligoflexia bacterium]MBF0364202.1 NUDIX hydrolase [Oligoflexia bacterium]